MCQPNLSRVDLNKKVFSYFVFPLFFSSQLLYKWQDVSLSIGCVCGDFQRFFFRFVACSKKAPEGTLSSSPFSLESNCSQLETKVKAKLRQSEGGGGAAPRGAPNHPPSSVEVVHKGLENFDIFTNGVNMVLNF